MCGLSSRCLSFEAIHGWYTYKTWQNEQLHLSIFKKIMFLFNKMLFNMTVFLITVI